ncbi:MAG: glycosyltransferase family 39 protein [Acidobacteriota bacterium]
MEEEFEVAGRRRAMAAAGLLALIGLYGWLVVSHRGSAVGSSDGAGYYNAARALAAGHPVEPIERLAVPVAPGELLLFVPLGTVPGPTPGTITSFYPPGLPLHFWAAAAVAGWDRGPYLVSPLAAAGALLLLYLVARELGASRTGALAAATVTAFLPVLNFQAVQPMSDTLAMFWALAAVWFALRSRAAPPWALAAGFAFGAGVLVRPASAILVLPLLFAMTPNVKAWLFFVLGGLPCAAFQLAYDRACYGAVLRTGYGIGGAFADFAVGNFPARFLHYGYWIGRMMTPFVPAAFLGFLFLRRSRAGLRTRLLLGTWFFVFFLLYCFYKPYDAWWWTRYLLPGIPALAIGAVLFTEEMLVRLRARATAESRAAHWPAIAKTAAVVALLLVALTGYRIGRRYRVLKIGREASVYPETLRWASQRVPGNALIVSMQFTGAMKAYGWGTFVRWDWMTAERFPEFRRRMEAAGYSFYALMLPFEVKAAASSLPGNWRYLESRGDVSLWRLD